jgi:hypothetical protein
MIVFSDDLKFWVLFSTLTETLSVFKAYRKFGRVVFSRSELFFTHPENLEFFHVPELLVLVSVVITCKPIIDLLKSIGMFAYFLLVPVENY